MKKTVAGLKQLVKEHQEKEEKYRQAIKDFSQKEARANKALSQMPSTSHSTANVSSSTPLSFQMPPHTQQGNTFNPFK